MVPSHARFPTMSAKRRAAETKDESAASPESKVKVQRTDPGSASAKKAPRFPKTITDMIKDIIKSFVVDVAVVVAIIVAVAAVAVGAHIAPSMM